jgi:hypothetical protein
LISQIATKSKIKLVGSLDEALTYESTQEGFTGKNHPGRIHNPVSALPSPLLQAIDKTLGNLENVCILQLVVFAYIFLCILSIDK